MSSPGVLVLGEEKIVVKDLTVCLGNLGYQLVGAPSTVEEAIRMMPDVRPDLVLVNAAPRVDFDVLRAGDSITRSFRIPIVFLTTHHDKPLMDHLKTVGSFGYLEKPFSQKSLRGILEKALDLHGEDSCRYSRGNGGTSALTRS
ncbi:MAG: response regulator [Thermodesulfobacteriota bacterium]